jgi:hypothetical protein
MLTVSRLLSFGACLLLSNGMQNLQLNKCIKTSRMIFRIGKDRPSFISLASSDKDAPEWLNRSNFEEIIELGSSGENDQSSKPLFDILYESENNPMLQADKNSISQMTLRDISDSYYFSLAFIGDFLVQMGCQPPIDVDVKLSNFLTGSQIFTLMEALNSLDAYESNGGNNLSYSSDIIFKKFIYKAMILIRWRSLPMSWWYLNAIF